LVKLVASGRQQNGMSALSLAGCRAVEMHPLQSALIPLGQCRDELRTGFHAGILAVQNYAGSISDYICTVT
jgi:hypothetical protein